MKFSIEKVVKMTGIAAASLRNWEKRYGFPAPERNETGHRFYSQRDIEFLKKAQELLCAGESLSELASLYKQSCQDTLKEIITRKEGVVDDVVYRVELIYSALLKFDLPSLQIHYQILNVKLGPEQIFDRVFAALLNRLKTEAAQRKISLAQEHFAASFVRNKLASFLAMDLPPSQHQVILAASLAGASYEASLLMVAAHLRLKGYPIYYFGTELPLSELQTMVRQLKPQVLCLSYDNKSQLMQDLPVLEQMKIPVCISGLENMQIKTTSPQIFICQNSIGSQAAAFVEMICHRQAL